MKEPIGIMVRWMCRRCHGKCRHAASWPPDTTETVQCHNCLGTGVVDEPMPLATLKELLNPKRRSHK